MEGRSERASWEGARGVYLGLIGDANFSACSALEKAVADHLECPMRASESEISVKVTVTSWTAHFSYMDTEVSAVGCSGGWGGPMKIDWL